MLFLFALRGSSPCSRTLWLGHLDNPGRQHLHPSSTSLTDLKPCHEHRLIGSRTPKSIFLALLGKILMSSMVEALMLLLWHQSCMSFRSFASRSSNVAPSKNFEATTTQSAPLRSRAQPSQQQCNMSGTSISGCQPASFRKWMSPTAVARACATSVALLNLSNSGSSQPSLSARHL